MNWRGAAGLVAVAVLFLIVNHDAYRGYFSDDDLDNLSWTRVAGNDTFYTGVITPKFFPWNFRPVGHLMYRVLGRTVKLDFRWYVAVLHIFHLLNLVLLWLLLRRLGLDDTAVLAGVLFFAVHMALFDAYWKPMYIFDVLCGFFTLLTLLAYAHGRLILSLLAFWLAYKSKELAVVLPPALALYEYTLGGKRWKRLLPFFAISLWFGVQGLLSSSGTDTTYTLRFGLVPLWKCIAFYSSQVFLLPYAGLALLLAAFVLWWRNERVVWLGLTIFGCLLVPMLLLPYRLFAVYLYIPLIGLAIAGAALAARVRPVWLILFFALWLPWSYREFRVKRRAELAAAAENRTYVGALAAFLKSSPPISAATYDGQPAPMHHWGVEGALRFLSENPNLALATYGAGKDYRPVLSWNRRDRKLLVDWGDTPEIGFVDFARAHPVRHLEKGWFVLEDAFRWAEPTASVRLARPAAARSFELNANIPDTQLRATGPVVVNVTIDGEPAPGHTFSAAGSQTVRLPLPERAPGPVRVEIQVAKSYDAGDGRQLGLAISSFGFRP